MLNKLRAAEGERSWNVFTLRAYLGELLSSWRTILLPARGVEEKNVRIERLLGLRERDFHGCYLRCSRKLRL